MAEAGMTGENGGIQVGNIKVKSPEEASMYEGQGFLTPQEAQTAQLKLQQTPSQEGESLGAKIRRLLKI